MVPPPMNAYCPTVQYWCTGLKAPTRGVVLNDHVAGKRRGVGQDAMAAHDAVVADMHIGHQQELPSRCA